MAASLLFIGFILGSVVTPSVYLENTPGPSCPYLPIKRKTGSSGGKLYSGIEYRSVCEAFCCTLTACSGYQWQRVQQQCWTYTVLGGFTEDDESDFYQKALTTTTTGTTVSTTTIASSWEQATTTTATTTTTLPTGILIEDTDQNSPVSSPVSGGVSPLVLGGSVAAVAVFIIIVTIFVCVCVRRIARHKKRTAKETGESWPKQEMEPPKCAIHDQPAEDEHEYEEIDDSIGPYPIGFHHQQYENVVPRCNVNDTLDVRTGGREKGMLEASGTISQWFTKKSMVKKLKKHKITTIEDLQHMSHEQMVEAGLKIGHRNQINRVLNDIATSRF